MFVTGLTALRKMMVYYSMSRELHPFVHVVHHSAMQSFIPSFYSLRPLVLAGGSLARLELVKVPAADGKVALVLVHAAPEVGDILCANAGSLVLGVYGGLAVLGLGKRLVDRCSGCAGSAAEPTANGVADGRTDSDTTVGREMLASSFYRKEYSVPTYAAVLAIWPKRPLPPLAAGAACWGAAGGGACWFAGGWATVLAWRA